MAALTTPTKGVVNNRFRKIGVTNVWNFVLNASVSGAQVALLKALMFLIPRLEHTNTIVVHKSTGRVFVSTSAKSSSRLIPVGMCKAVAVAML